MAIKTTACPLEIFACRSAICSSPFPIADACISFSNARCRLLRSPALSRHRFVLEPTDLAKTLSRQEGDSLRTPRGRPFLSADPLSAGARRMHLASNEPELCRQCRRLRLCARTELPASVVHMEIHIRIGHVLDGGDVTHGFALG